MGATARTDLGTQAAGPDGALSPEGRVRIVVAYTRPALARVALASARSLTEGLSPQIVLAAVHVIPYPAAFHCPEWVRLHLERRLVRTVENSGVCAQATIALARTEEEGFRHLLAAGGAVLIGTRRRWWRTREARLAHRLERAGCKVLLVQLEG
jgi:hypothetical protein